MNPQSRLRQNWLILGALLGLSACSVAPPVCQPPVKAEPPPALLVLPQETALRNLYEILGLPWMPSESSSKPTPPDSEH